MSATRKTLALAATSVVLVPALLAVPALAGSASAAPAKHVVKPTTSIGVGNDPQAIAISKQLGEAFVVDGGGISVVSLLSHREVAQFGTGNLHGQNGIALVQDNTKAYVTNVLASNLTEIDTEHRAVSGTIPVGSGAVGVAKVNTKVGQRAYVGTQANTLVVIKTATDMVTRTVSLTGMPQTLTTAPGGKSVWVTGNGSSRIWVVSGAKAKITHKVTVRKVGPVVDVAFSHSGKTAYVAGLSGVAKVNVKTGKTVGFVSTKTLFPKGANISGIALNASGTKAYVVNSTFAADAPGKGKVRVVTTKTLKPGNAYRTGRQSTAIAVDTVRNTAYVVNAGSGSLSTFHTAK